MIEDLAGQLIGGRYRIRELVGIGGMDSTVWKAWQTGTERVVAVKVLPAAEEAAAKRFARGARIAANLNHPNCTVVHDYGRTDDGKLFLVMEYLHGQVLQEILGPEGMSANDTIHVADQVLQALEHAHGQRAVHRDLKPDNLFLSRKNDDPLHVKILDFGIAKYVEEDPENTSSGEEQASEGFEDLVTEQRQVCGTPQYMAPEQVVGARIDGRTDLYSLGVVMYRMLTGRLPFDGKTRYELYQKHLQEAPRPFREVRPDLAFPSDLEAIVMKALSKRPDQRFQSAADMRKALGLVELSEDRQRRGLRPRVSLKHTSPQNPGSAAPTILPHGTWTLSQPSPIGPDTTPALAPRGMQSPPAINVPMPAAPPPLPGPRARASVPDAELPLPTDLDVAAARAGAGSSGPALPRVTTAEPAPDPTTVKDPPTVPTATREPTSRPVTATNLLTEAVMRHPAGRSSLAVAPEVPRSTETEPNRAREAGERRRRRLGIAAVLAAAFLIGVGGVALTMQLVGGGDGGEGEVARTAEESPVAPAPVAEPPRDKVEAEQVAGAGVPKTETGEASRGQGGGAQAPAVDAARRDGVALAVTGEKAPDLTTTAGVLAGHALSEVPVEPTIVKVAVKIDSQPEGAIVSEGLTILGPTPLDLMVLPGRHVYTLEREGFVNAIVEVDAKPSAPPIARLLTLTAERKAEPVRRPGTPTPIAPRTPPSEPNKILQDLTPAKADPPKEEVKVEPKRDEPAKSNPQVKLLDDNAPGTATDNGKKPTIKLLGDDDEKKEAPKKPQVKVLEE